MPWRNAPDNFFPRYGAAHGHAQEPTPSSAVKFGGWECAQEPPPGSAVKHCRFLGTGGGGGYNRLRLPLFMACTFDLDPDLALASRKTTSKRGC